MPWSQWKTRFDNYLIARGGNVSDTQKRALLLCAVGDEAYRVFENLPTPVKQEGETDYDLAVRQFSAHFEPKVNIIMERFTFRQRVQHLHESTSDYVNILRGLARKCNFGSMEDELIRDQVVEKTPHSNLRQRFLQEQDLDLAKLLTMAESYERSLQEAAAIAPSSTAGATAPQAVRAVAKASKKAPTGPPPGATSPAATHCTNCGRRDHQARDPSCPALRITCSRCSKRGHFAAWCRGEKVTPKSGPARSRGGRSGSLPAVRELNVLACRRQNVHDVSTVKLSCPVSITAGSVTRDAVDLQVDTGATCSLFSLQRAKQLFKGVSYEPSEAKLYGFGHSPLRVCGVLPVVIRYNEREVNTSFYLVDTPRLEAIMGMDLLVSLGLTLHPASHSVFDVTDEISASGDQLHLPAIEGYAHKIQLKPDAVPQTCKLRRLPLSVRKEVSAELDRLLQADIIERAEASQWVSPLLVTRKKDGKLRICTDLRGPNSQIVPEVHPLPTIDDLERQLRGTVYSRIDLKSAYFQLRLHEDSRDVTAFLTMDGLFRWKRVPMGLVSSGSAFQKLLGQLLHGLDGCGHYLDDILVSGRNQSEHDARLNAVMNRLREANITINMQKSVFSQEEIEFCGHRLSKDGVAPLHSAIRAVVEAPHPTGLKELRSFLGTTAWFSRFIPAYSTVVQPLTAMLRKDVPFEWGTAAEHAFTEIKDLISSSPVMVPFSAGLETIVTSDASDRGAGAVLTQVQPGGEERPVAYWSRTFTDAETRYSVSEKEALSAVNAVEHWRIYLWGRSFTLRTDHSALTTLLTPQSANRAGARIARWQSRLLPYSYTVEYRPGHTIPVADTLSRLPLPDTAEADTDSDDIVALITDEARDVITEDDVRAASASDPALCELRSVIRSGWPDAARKCTPETRDYFPVRHELQVRDDGVILRGPDRVVVPASLREKYLQVAHRTHDGVVRTKQLLRDLAWWPGMAKAAAALVTDCPTCSTKDAVLSQQARPAPMQAVELPDRPWKKLAIDIVGPIPDTLPGARYAITVTDYYSKWPEVALTGSVTTDDVISFLSQLWSREGFCDELISDNGPQFTSDQFEKYLTDRGIKHVRAAAYWPRGNAAVERLNKEVKAWILEAAQLSSRSTAVLTDHVRQRLAQYRATPHCTTGESPSVLLHGRRMRLNLPVTSAPSADNALRRRVKKQQLRNTRDYNARQAVRPPAFKSGDTVRVRRQGHVPKDVSRFSSPRRVTGQVGPATFLLSDGTRRNAAHLARSPAPAQPQPADQTGIGTGSGSLRASPTRTGPPTVSTDRSVPLSPGRAVPSAVPPPLSPGRAAPPAAPPSLSPGRAASPLSSGRQVLPSTSDEHAVLPPTVQPDPYELSPSSFGRRRFLPARLR